VLAKVVFDNWQFSGITTRLSGAQGGFSYTFTNVPTGILSGNGAIGGGANRPDTICDPTLRSRERTFERQFRTECIAAPTDQFTSATRRAMSSRDRAS